MESCSAASNETYSNPYVMDEITFTNNDGALPAEGNHPNHNTPTRGAVVPPHRFNEIPGPRDTLFLEENVINELSVNNSNGFELPHMKISQNELKL